MRTRFLSLAGLVGALVVLPSISEAQAADKISFGVMGGLSLPMATSVTATTAASTSPAVCTHR